MKFFSFLFVICFLIFSPFPVSAHGFGERYDLPLPLSYFMVGAAATVGLSFLIIGWFFSQSSYAKSYWTLDLFSLKYMKFILNLITTSVNEKRKIYEVKLLTFPKVLGFGFNPLSIYFCYNNKGLLLHSVFEVRNTFGDIHHYILKNTQQNGDSQKTLKKLFVSPFYQKKGYYHLYSKQIDRKILTSVKYIIDNITVFSASMDLKEIEFKNLNILKGLITFSLFPGKIWLNIHLQALFLWLKKVAFYKIPKSEKIKHSFGNKISRNK